MSTDIPDSGRVRVASGSAWTRAVRKMTSRRIRILSNTAGENRVLPGGLLAERLPILPFVEELDEGIELRLASWPKIAVTVLLHEAKSGCSIRRLT